MPGDLVITSPRFGDRFPFAVRVSSDQGGWTPGPHVQIDAGNVVEFDPDELRWLIEEAGPRALARLEELRRGG